MKKASRKSPISGYVSCRQPVRVGAKYFVSAAGSNITSIEIVPQVLSREEYANRGRHLMSMYTLHKARAIRISSEAR